jgi:flagellar assembly protein FliH
MVPPGGADAFRPKSLLELAKQRREEDKAAALQDAPAKDDTVEAGHVPLSEAGDDAADHPAAPPPADAGVMPPPEPLAQPDPRDTAAGAELPGGDAGAEGSTLPETGAASPVPAAVAAATPTDASQPLDPATQERIRAEAYAEGRAAAEAELRDSLTAAIQALQAAVEAISQPPASATAVLRADIAEAVLRLASERAGHEIDSLPEVFLERIEALADRIHARSSQPVLRLHPDDLAAVEPLIEGSDILSAMRIVAAQDLSRGDVDLAVDGLRLSDRILSPAPPRKAARVTPKSTPEPGAEDA